jgi:hypothetical protein
LPIGYLKYQFLQNGISNTSALKRRLVFQIPIGTLGANWYFECQLLLQMPIVASNADCYFKCRLLLLMPIVTSNTNRVTIHQEEEEEEEEEVHYLFKFGGSFAAISE